MSKWYTCCPRQFEAEEPFFWRDTGILCRGLQRLGYESKVILLGPALKGDLPDVIRATREEMESPEWWRKLELEGVILGAWALHKDAAITRAIAAAGIRLVMHLDGSCTHFPLFQRLETLKTFWRAERDLRSNLANRIFFFLLRSAPCVLTSLRYSYLKYLQLRYVHALTCQTTTSHDNNLRLCRLFGGEDHGVNVQLVGFPIPPAYRWDPSIKKDKRVIAIGRWEDLRFKRPYMLMSVCEEVARRNPDLKIDIFGTKTASLEKWHQRLPAAARENIVLHGHQPGPVLSQGLQRAQVLFCPSSSEGGPLAMFEGLSCGVTPVAIDSPQLPGPRWAAEYHHADLAAHDTVEAYVDALERALGKWESGEYSAEEISKEWISRTDLEAVIRKMIDAASMGDSPAEKEGKALSKK